MSGLQNFPRRMHNLRNVALVIPLLAFAIVAAVAQAHHSNGAKNTSTGRPRPVIGGFRMPIGRESVN